MKMFEDHEHKEMLYTKETMKDRQGLFQYEFWDIGIPRKLFFDCAYPLGIPFRFRFLVVWGPWSNMCIQDSNNGDNDNN